ncbi:unnamed protein product [Prorocentrum cordatum]|uniref:Hexose transporter 1 n=1 Tax=Prorocentrum cordatum TaxID=2364126 RepID=A0ABN9R6F0_9DINO|nr:unnamed protein product [Polarella glacialis]
MAMVTTSERRSPSWSTRSRRPSWPGAQGSAATPRSPRCCTTAATSWAWTTRRCLAWGSAGSWTTRGSAAAGCWAWASRGAWRRWHVDAKRYLCCIKPEYHARLSDASLTTLGYQGGPMAPEEAAAFERDELFRRAAACCHGCQNRLEPEPVAPKLPISGGRQRGQARGPGARGARLAMGCAGSSAEQPPKADSSGSKIQAKPLPTNVKPCRASAAVPASGPEAPGSGGSSASVGLRGRVQAPGAAESGSRVKPGLQTPASRFGYKGASSTLRTPLPLWHCPGISSFLFGYSLCVLDTCLGLLPVVFEWCNNEWQADCFASRACQALVNASVYLGAAVGALLSGRLYEAGARFQIMTSDVIFIVGALLGATAQGVIGLLLSRLVSGVGLGLSAIAAPMYIAEVSPRERRGSKGALHGVFIGVGIWFSSTELVLFRRVLPVDPPGFLLQKDRQQDRHELAKGTYGLEPPRGAGGSRLAGEAPDAEPGSAAARAAGALHETGVEQILSEMIYACEQAAQIPRLHIHQALCDRYFQPALFVGFTLAAFQQLSGINALMSYSNALFSQAGIPSSQLTLASTIMATCNALAAIMSSKVVDRWGRRALLLGGPFLQMAAMLCISECAPGHESWLCPLPGAVVGPTMVLCCFCLFTVSFAAGLGAVTWIYLSEIYIMEIRGAALSACGVINWLSCFVVVFGMPFLGLHGACKFFGVVCFVGFVGVYLFVQETKGCSMDDNPLTPQSDRGKSPLLCTPQSEEDTARAEVRVRIEHPSRR